MYMGVWVCLCTCECMYQRTPEKWVGHPNAAVTGGCELPNLDAGNWTWMLCKGGSHSQPRAISQVHNRGFLCGGICVSMATQMAPLLFYIFFLKVFSKEEPLCQPIREVVFHSSCIFQPPFSSTLIPVWMWEWPRANLNTYLHNNLSVCETNLWVRHGLYIFQKSVCIFLRLWKHWKHADALQYMSFWLSLGILFQEKIQCGFRFVS